MRYRERILAGTAIGIMMSAAPFAAHALEAVPTLPAVAPVAADGARIDAPVVLAQAEDEVIQEGQAQGRQTQGEPAQDRRDQKQQAQQAGEQKAQPEQQPKADANGGAGQKREQTGQAAEQQSETGKAAEEKAEPAGQAAEQKRQAAEEKAGQAKERTGKAAERKKQAAEENVKEQAGEQRSERKKQTSEKAEQAEQATPEEKKPAVEEKARQREEAVEGEAGKGQEADEQRGAASEAAKQRGEAGEKPSGEAQQQEQSAGEENAPQSTRDNQAAERGRDRQRKQKEQQAGEQEKQQPEEATGRQRREETAGEADKQQVREAEEGEQQQELDEKARRALDEQKPLPENAAPVLDSQKGRERGEEADRDRGNQRNQPAGEQASEGRDAEGGQQAERAPRSDRAAQRDININIGDIEPVTAEEGRRIDRAQWRDLRRHRRDARVVNRVGDRTIIEFNNNIIVQGDDHDRIGRHARDVYYEVLPDDRRREVVIRPDGSKVITVRNSYGDIIRRTRVLPNGQEYLLVYSGPRHDRWHDPAEDLPPLHLTIPVSEYILEADTVRDADVYYEFLDQPPVAPVQELYTIDQVRYSARVRDTMRRVDLDTINFETGSAEVAPAEMRELGALADAMARIIDDDPAETFLIEGHTDAVGSEESNLALSDERAEAVADALTQEYGIPPENMFTQGYGEEYLKIDTEGASRANRRVAVRRITPLVTPVASAEQ